MLDELQNARSVVGAKQTRRALLAGEVKKLFLAGDADPALTGPLAELAARQGVAAATVGSMRDLGAACGIAVKAACAAVVSADA